MKKNDARTQALRLSLSPVVSLNAFQAPMLATWHSFEDGLYYPALVGMLGDLKLIYIVLHNGELSSFATWEEARDVAVAAKQVTGSPLRMVQGNAAPFSARLDLSENEEVA